LFITNNAQIKEFNTNTLTSFKSVTYKKPDLTAAEAKRQIDEFKSVLSQELNKIIEEEKEKEDERMKKYKEELKEEAKKNLEEIFAQERNESSKRVFIFNEYFCCLKIFVKKFYKNYLI